MTDCFGRLFQSTLSHGERQYRLKRADTGTLFQSTLSHGERPMCHNFPSRLYYISIHSLAWRETDSTLQYSSDEVISIHSLAWRETGRVIDLEEMIYISIHSLAWRETPHFSISLKTAVFYFNPLSRMERDAAPQPSFIPLNLFQSTLSHGERLQSFRNSII